MVFNGNPQKPAEESRLGIFPIIFTSENTSSYRPIIYQGVLSPITPAENIRPIKTKIAAFFCESYCIK
jgi:hypothetical protein